jgi:hypothetical protein
MIASIFKWLVRLSIALFLAGIGAVIYFREPILDGMKRMTSAADREARRIEKLRRKAKKAVE